MSWPPRGFSWDSELSKHKAELLIANGALFFEGLCSKANHALIRFYATVSCAAAGKQLEASGPPGSSLPDASLVLSGQPIEQPTMAQCFGALPGTVTLNRYINAISDPRQPDRLSKYDVQPRVTDYLLVLQRLHYLMSNGWDEDIEIAEEFLYTQLAYDPLWQKGASPQLAKQIMALIAALSDPTWIDFRDPTSQVLANYYDTEDVEVETQFWRQLLLSVELDLRLQAAGAQEQSMISHIPEKVAWDLALSKVWLSKMALTPIDEGFLRPATTFRVTALTKNIQKERLLSFAHNMKWVYIDNVKHMLEEDSDGSIPLEFQNSHASSWITGTILPGPSVCWLAMKCLIDCDLTIINAPPGFDNMKSNFGFQYASSTYWYFESIIGKVLGASQGVNQDYGWIGPCIPTDDLFTLQTALIYAEDVPVKTSKRRVQKLAAHSAPLGPPAPNFPIRDYTLPLPDTTDATDSIRIQKLALSPRSPFPSSPNNNSNDEEDPPTYDTAVVFVVQNQTVPIRLRYNVSFIHCPPCHDGGPHPLFWDYAHQSLKPDELLLDLRCWNGVFVDAETPAEESLGRASSFDSSSSSPSSSFPSSFSSSSGSGTPVEKHGRSRGPDSVLVVQADGVSDNEVLARAWASHVGFSAVVARTGETCVACAVRMAFAAEVDMVIFGGGGDV